jgi:hypothetical protein
MSFYVPEPVQDPHLYLLTRVRWYHRLWHLFKTRVLRRDCMDIYKISEYPAAAGYNMILEPHYQCAQCLKYVPWIEGCADDRPELCDDCYSVYEKRIDNPV